MKKHNGRRLAVVSSSVGAVLFATVGIVAGGALAGGDVQVAPTPRAYPIETNDAGQTYGSEAAFLPGQGPDLVLVYGDSGETGYVYRDDLYPPAPRSPEEAAATQTAPGDIDSVLDVYLADGVTKIDTFTIYGSSTESTYTR